MRFGREHAFFRGSTAWAFLAAKFFDTGPFGGGPFFSNQLDLVEKELAREKTIQTLLTRFLAFYLQSAWPVQKHHAGGGLIDVLAAMPTGADKRLFYIRFAHAKGSHALGKLRFFVG